MPSIPGIGHQQAIRVLEKVGFKDIREGKHTVMSDGERHVAAWRVTEQSTSLTIPQCGSPRTIASSPKSLSSVTRMRSSSSAGKDCSVTRIGRPTAGPDNVMSGCTQHLGRLP
jgi:hypothetical protein